MGDCNKVRSHTKIFMFGFISIFILFFIPLNSFIIAPGKVFHLTELIQLSGSLEKDHFYAPSVAVWENKYFSYFDTKLFNKLNTNIFYWFCAIIDPELELKRLSDFLPQGTTSQQYEQALQSETNLSLVTVRYVISQQLEKPLEEVSIITNLTHEGSSVGLALALEGIQQLGKKDLVRGRKIGAIGVIDRDGTIYKVGAIQQKILSAEKGRLDMLLIPKGHEEEVDLLNTSLTLVFVETIDEALKVLA